MEIDGKITKKTLPINDIDSIYVFGELDINTKAINYLSQYDIPIHFFNYYGFSLNFLKYDEQLLL